IPSEPHTKKGPVKRLLFTRASPPICLRLASSRQCAVHIRVFQRCDVVSRLFACGLQARRVNGSAISALSAFGYTQNGCATLFRPSTRLHQLAATNSGSPSPLQLKRPGNAVIDGIVYLARYFSCQPPAERAVQATASADGSR